MSEHLECSTFYLLNSLAYLYKYKRVQYNELIRDSVFTRIKRLDLCFPLYAHKLKILVYLAYLKV